MQIRIKKNIAQNYDPKNRITNHVPFDTKRKMFTENGIFSEKIFGSIEADAVNYSCQCGKSEGKFKEDTFCPHCRTLVTSTMSTLSRQGFIKLDHDVIINPVFYNFLKDLAPKGVLDAILGYEANMTLDGELYIDPAKLESNPYFSTSLIDFRSKYEEILEYIYKKSNSKSKETTYAFLKKFPKERIFINAFPVYSVILRPVMREGNTLTFDEVNNYYNSMIKTSNILNNEFSMILKDNRAKLLQNLQYQANEIFNKQIENLSGKNGFIRSNNLGTRVNFSARAVIVPLKAGYDIDSVKIPYKVFLELYRIHIITILRAEKGISEIEANQLVDRALSVFDSEIYRIMKEIISKTKHGCKAFLNR